MRRHADRRRPVNRVHRVEIPQCAACPPAGCGLESNSPCPRGPQYDPSPTRVLHAGRGARRRAAVRAARRSAQRERARTRSPVYHSGRRRPSASRRCACASSWTCAAAADDYADFYCAGDRMGLGRRHRCPRTPATATRTRPARARSSAASPPSTSTGSRGSYQIVFRLKQKNEAGRRRQHQRAGARRRAAKALAGDGAASPSTR